MAVTEPVEIQLDGQTRMLSPEEAGELVDALVRRAQEFLAAGDLATAKLKGALALKLDPNHPKALEVFADVASADGDEATGSGLYRAAYDAGNRSPAVVMRRLADSIKSGDLDRAKESAIELIRIAPKIKTGWKNLTEIQIVEEDPEGASATLKDWVVQFGESDETRYCNAVISWLKGDREAAVAEFQKLAAAETSLGQVYHYLAVHFYDRDECNHVIPYLVKYLELEGPDDEAEEILMECREILREAKSGRHPDENGADPTAGAQST